MGGLTTTTTTCEAGEATIRCGVLGAIYNYVSASNINKNFYRKFVSYTLQLIRSDVGMIHSRHTRPLRNYREALRLSNAVSVKYLRKYRVLCRDGNHLINIFRNRWRTIESIIVIRKKALGGLGDH